VRHQSIVFHGILKHVPWAVVDRLEEQHETVNGAVGAIVAPRGRLLLVLNITIAHGRIVGIENVADPERLRQLDLTILDD
jgi:hypothetical protein